MTNTNANLEFQISDWNTYHDIDGDEEERYIIQLFGRTEDDKDVCLKIIGFTPFFYVEVPSTWGDRQADIFVTFLKKKVSWITRNDPKYDYDLSQSLVKYRLVLKHKFKNFSNKKFFKFLMLVFKSQVGMRVFSNLFFKPLNIPALARYPMFYNRYESNIEPHIRFMHINNISSCGWISVNGKKLTKNNQYSNCDHSYVVDWKDVLPASNDNRMAPFIIMGYDIECVSGDENFPQAERRADKIIQIGMTLYRYGSMNCYEEHILTLKDCNDIPGVCVECYQTEKELIRAFAKKISTLRPDFKVGYNNLRFDDNYIFDRIARIDQVRADKQNIPVEKLENRFIDEILTTMGKVNNKYLMEVEGIKKSLTFFEEKTLSSSAMGDNEFKFFQIPGIVSIDMMKVIMRNYSLISYKLDNVSANFITEPIASTNLEDKTNDQVAVTICTRSTKALEKDSYIQIMVDDGYSPSSLREGAKYKVLDIETDKELKCQCIKTIITQKDANDLRDAIANPLLKLFWTFAKDDMKYYLINKYFKENNTAKLTKVAIYCLKDCKLANLLQSKLEIIVNSIAMAKVCHVPLSYLFLRGQGVKIFSLVSKKCREKNYLIPVLRKKKANEEEDEGYEGATVINPKPAVYLSPIGVLDYSSLYPNSMRERNLSSECYVDNPEYDNLPGYIYHDIYITLKDKKGKILRNIDGTRQKERHRFAQEIITDEQMTLEMKSTFDIIDQETNDKINTITNQKELDDSTRNLLIEIEQQNPNLECYKKDIMKQVKLTKHDREKLIENEKCKAQKRKDMEKAKKYNISQNQKVKYGVLPEILTELLNKRKDTNAQLAKEKDPFLICVLNALQLAYKVTANSLYGQTGAPTSPIFFMSIAASTTAIGRERLYYAKKMVEENFEGSEVIYGDSVTGDTPLTIRVKTGDIHITTIEELGTSWVPYEGFKMGESNRTNKQQAFVDCEVWTANGWSNIKRVIRHKTIKKIYRVLTDTGCVDVTEDHSLLDKNKKIIKPTECKVGTQLLHGFMEPNNTNHNMFHEEAYILGSLMARDPSVAHIKEVLNSSTHIKQAYINGFCSANGYEVDIKDKVIAHCLFYLLTSLGYNVTINTTSQQTYRLIYSKTKQNNSIAIKKIQFMYTTNDYVYDLETEDGTFHAGIGKLIVKNTDSIFINFHIKDEAGVELTDKTALIKTIEISKKAAKLICDNVPKPQGIVYEKTYHPFILIAKKKYVGLLFVDDANKYYVKSMGIVLKRRDNAPIVKIVIGGIIDHILKNRDISKAIEYAKYVIGKLMNGEYPIEKFIISKTLKAKYKKPSTIAHKVLADRIALRDPGNKPMVNDRIPFVFIVTKPKRKKKNVKDLQGDLIEHPDYVIENNLKLDYLYYLEHQIIKPAAQILELVLSQRKVTKLFNNYIFQETNKRMGKQSLQKWMDREIPIIESADTFLKPEIPRDESHKALPRVGKTRKYECQSMEKWTQDGVASDEWELE